MHFETVEFETEYRTFVVEAELYSDETGGWAECLEIYHADGKTKVGRALSLRLDDEYGDEMVEALFDQAKEW